MPMISTLGRRGWHDWKFKIILLRQYAKFDVILGSTKIPETLSLHRTKQTHFFSQPIITICANRLTSDQLLQEKLVAYTKMLTGPSIWTPVNLYLNRKWNAHSTPCLYCHSEACNNQVWLTLDSQESFLRVIGLKGLLVGNFECERGATGLSLRDRQLHQSKGASVILKYKNHRSEVGSFLKQNLSFEESIGFMLSIYIFLCKKVFREELLSNDETWRAPSVLVWGCSWSEHPLHWKQKMKGRKEGRERGKKESKDFLMFGEMIKSRQLWANPWGGLLVDSWFYGINGDYWKLLEWGLQRCNSDRKVSWQSGATYRVRVDHWDVFLKAASYPRPLPLSLLHHGCHKVSRHLCHTLPPPHPTYTHFYTHASLHCLRPTVSHGLKSLKLRAIMNPSSTELFSKELCQRGGKSD